MDRVPPPTLTADRSALQAYFEATWALYEWLFSAVDDTALYHQPDPLRHPLIFYLGHTAAFYLNKLRLAGVVPTSVDAELEHLFAMGVDPHAAQDLELRVGWPEVARVRAFRRQIHTVVRGVIDTAPLPVAITWHDPLWALHMAMEHDRIHFETSSVLIRQLPTDCVRRPAGWLDGPRGRGAPPLSWQAEAATTVTLGRGARPDVLDSQEKLARTCFGWGNEYGTRTVAVPAFEATTTLISQAECARFVAEGGYHNPALWTPEGWQWRTTAQVSHPRFWVPDGAGDFRYRGMFEVVDMPLAWPVELNGHEAAACARWLGGRLPTEAEWAALAADAPHVDGDVWAVPRYNLDMAHGSPVPVDWSRPTPRGFHDVHGNVWQWLADDFQPLPGYAPHALYPDFSLPYFDTQHAVLRGGAWASTGMGASRWYRLWFRRHFYQHAGVRVVRDV